MAAFRVSFLIVTRVFSQFQHLLTSKLVLFLLVYRYSMEKKVAMSVQEIVHILIILDIISSVWTNDQSYDCSIAYLKRSVSSWILDPQARRAYVSVGPPVCSRHCNIWPTVIAERKDQILVAREQNASLRRCFSVRCHGGNSGREG